MQKLAHDNGLSGLLVGSSPLAMSLSLGAKSPTKSPTGTGTHQPSSAASSTVITSPGLPDPYSRPTTRGANPHRLGSARPASTSGARASGSVPATTAAQHLGASGSGGTQTFLQRTRERLSEGEDNFWSAGSSSSNDDNSSSSGADEYTPPPSPERTATNIHAGKAKGPQQTTPLLHRPAMSSADPPKLDIPFYADYGAGDEAFKVKGGRPKGLWQRPGQIINNPTNLWDDIPTYLVQISTLSFTASVLTIYFVLAAFFGGLYMYRVEECITHTDTDAVASKLSEVTTLSYGESYAHAFFFSVQTLSTVGYGTRTPSCGYSEIVSAVQCFAGILYMAAVTGLVFARITRPRSRLLLSDQICVGVDNRGLRVLEFRVANGHKSPAMCVEASAVLSQFNREQICKSYHRLVLEQKDDPGWLSHVQTYTHIIDSESPLYGMDYDAFAEHGSMVHVVISAMNGVRLQPMVVTANYGTDTSDEKHVVFGSKFAAMTSPNINGNAIVFDYAKLSSHETAPDTTCIRSPSKSKGKRRWAPMFG